MINDIFLDNSFVCLLFNLCVSFLVLSTVQIIFEGGNQISYLGLSPYIMVVLFPGGLFTLHLLDSLHT